MKKYLSFLLVFLFISSFSFAEDLSNESITHLMQTALDSNARLLQKHSDVKTYFENFLPLWKDFLTKLLAQNAGPNDWETLFGKNEALTRATVAQIKPLKPPSDFKDFHEAITKGMEAMADWSLGMKDRIHYAKTDYQKNAYMKKIEGFRKEWYDSFFGPAVDEISGTWATYLEGHWSDGLTDEQAKAIKENRAVSDYLNKLHSITHGHLRTMMDIADKARGSKDDTDETQKFITSLSEEAKDFRKTRANIEKLNPPDVFKDFHRLQLAWLESVTNGTQTLYEIETGQRDNAPKEKIDALVNKKNQIDQVSTQLHEQLDKAYNDALGSVTRISASR